MQLFYSNHFAQKNLFVMEKANGYSDDDNVFSAAMKLATSSVLPMTLKAAVELGLFEIMAAAGHKFLCPAEIASQIHTQNADAPAMVERILRFLASSSVLKCEVTEKPDGERVVLYGLSPVCKYFVGDKNGVSLAPYILYRQDKAIIDAWCHLKDGVVDGVIPFNKAHGMTVFEYATQDHKYSEIFNQAMHSVTTFIMNKVFEVYKGFEGLTQIIDVGGGSGAALAAIVSKYPNIRGINYDLPHVIKDAPPCQGVEHVGGDMFQSVPIGEAIFLKLLTNCWKALPESGKLIVVEALLPQYPGIDDASDDVLCSDLRMMASSVGGKERTETEYDALARKAGFARIKVICNVHSKCVIEFYKM